MRNRQKWIPSIGMAAVCALLLTLAGCGSTFEGDSVKNADSYALTVQAMTGTDMHTMKLNKGDVLRIRFETGKGTMYLEITEPDGRPIYQGNGKAATDFTVEIPADGAYMIAVEGQKARGSVRVDAQRKSATEDTVEEQKGGHWGNRIGEDAQ